MTAFPVEPNGSADDAVPGDNSGVPPEGERKPPRRAGFTADRSVVWLVAEREIKTRARTKVFRVGAIILFVVVFGGIALSTLAGDVEVGTPVIGLQGAAIGYQDDFTAGHRGSRSRSSNRQTRRPPLPTAMSTLCLSVTR